MWGDDTSCGYECFVPWRLTPNQVSGSLLQSPACRRAVLTAPQGARGARVCEGRQLSAVRKQDRVFVHAHSQGVAKKTSLATAFLELKLEEYEALRQEIEALTCEVGSDGSVELGKWS